MNHSCLNNRHPCLNIPQQQFCLMFISGCFAAGPSRTLDVPCRKVLWLNPWVGNCCLLLASQPWLCFERYHGRLDTMPLKSKQGMLTQLA